MHSQQIVEFGGPLVAHDYPTPEPTGTEVLMRVHGCGVCHSDLHIWDGYFDLGGGNKVMVIDRGMKMPFTLGHEIVGEVVALGPEAEGATVGDKRIVYPWVGCGECAICTRGNDNLCVTQRFLGTRVDGGYSDHVLAPHPRYLVDYEGVDDDIAGTYACSGLTAYASLKKVASLGADDNVVMIGAGGVGLSAVHLAPSVIEAGVIVADTDAAKRQAALAAGAWHAIDSTAEDAVKTLRTELTKGGASAVIDFVGSPATAQFGLDVLRNGGTLVIVGLYGGQLPLSLVLLPFRSLRIMGSFVGSLPDLRALMALVKERGVPPIPYETRPLSEASQALVDLKAGHVTGRVVLRP
ncbi:MAG TPA: alcohol dehydrogenase [Rhodospirillales bacterium]|nr:alcohol dehydrogenase [Rhodospirillales bacterium]